MKKLLPFFFLVLFACKSKQEIVEVNKKIDLSSIIEIAIDQNDKVLFTLKNISEDEIHIYKAGKLNIEKLDNDTWSDVRILLCPCDDPCNAINTNEKLAAGESFVLIWNTEESWCETNNEDQKNFVKQKAEKGTYRIKISVIIGNGQPISLYKQFILN